MVNYPPPSLAAIRAVVPSEWGALTSAPEGRGEAGKGRKEEGRERVEEGGWGEGEREGGGKTADETYREMSLSILGIPTWKG